MHPDPDPAPPAAGGEPDAGFVAAHTRAWVERAVIGLNLCPFAKGPQVKGLVRYAVTEARDWRALRAALDEELQRLAAADIAALETTVLAVPRMLHDFHEFNAFLDEADAAVAAAGLEGEFQVASFHPDYQFADAPPDDIGHATNRAPYPTLHLIREASIDRAVAAFPEAEAIYETNIATLRRLGQAGWAALQRQCLVDAVRAAAAPAGD